MALTWKTVVLTFDDGYRNTYELAFPLLNKYGCPATIFLTTDGIEHQRSLWGVKLHHWFQVTRVKELRLLINGQEHSYRLSDAMERKKVGKRLLSTLLRVDSGTRTRSLAEVSAKLNVDPDEDPFTQLPMLTWGQVREMAEAGIAIGGHTTTHPALATLSEEEILAELTDSKALIKQRIGRPVTLFAYPFGGEKEIGPHVAKLIQKVGYECACTTLRGRNGSGTDRFELRRIGVRDVPLPLFALGLLRV